MASQTASPLSQKQNKRRAEDDLLQEQRMTKRLQLLNLENNDKLYLPTNSSPYPYPTPSAPVISIPPNPPSSAGIFSQTSISPTTHILANNNPDDYMQIEETPNRVYIHNLDEELASASSADDIDRIIFIPDIERQLNKIPAHVLRADAPGPHSVISGRNGGGGGGELVLYSVPTSLSVPFERDSVRKAIIESRARARERAVEAVRYEGGAGGVGLSVESGKQGGDGDGGVMELNEDAMDIEL